MKYNIGDVVQIINIECSDYIFSDDVENGDYALILHLHYSHYTADINKDVGHSCNDFFLTERGQQLPNEEQHLNVLKKRNTTFLYIHEESIYFIDNITKEIIVFDDIFNRYSEETLDIFIQTMKTKYRK